MEAASSLCFVPMDEARFAAWRTRSVTDFAADKVLAGDWPAAEAPALALAGFEALLPLGLATPDHHLGSLTDAAGNAVGWAWIHVGPAHAESTVRPAFLYDFGIIPAWRGKGVGRAALAAVEAQARALGATRLDLHVFGHNLAARRLYEGAGFVVTDLNLSKPLS